jgi:hypothetical protein
MALRMSSGNVVRRAFHWASTKRVLMRWKPRRFTLAGLSFVGGRTDDGPMADYFERSPGNAPKAPAGGLCAAAPVRCVWPGPLTGRFNAVCTSWLADSIGNMGRKAEMAGTWPGTRSELANLAAIHRAHKPLQTCCCTRLHIRPRPKLVRQEQKLQRRPLSKQSGSSWRLLVVLSARVKLAP